MLLKPVSRPEPVDPSATYRILGAHWYAKGLYIKDVKSGSDIRAQKLFRVEEGDFVYNRLFGWKGSFAVATQETSGCHVSNEFPCFLTDRKLLDPRFLWRYLSRSSVWQEALSLSTGGTPTSRNRLKEEQLLGLRIPLPPLAEQRRILARIQDLTAKIEEARELQTKVESSLRGVLLSAYSRITNGAPRLRMTEVAPLRRRPVEIEASEKYYEVGIRSFGKGTFHKPPIEGASVGTKKLFRIETNDLLFNIVFAWEGAVAVARPQDQDRVGSHRFLTCVPKEGLATSVFLCFHFLTDQGLEQLGRASPGGAGRNRTLGLKALEDIPVPVPAFEKQMWFDSLLSKLESLKALQAETAAELDALLPSILDQAFKAEF
jgi:type I restriction enzyme S subunit